MDADGTLIVFIIAGVAGFLMLLVMLQFSQARESKRIQSRLERTRSRKGSGGGEASGPSLRVSRNSKFALIDQLARQLMPHPGQLRMRLDRTGFNLSFGQVVVFAAGAGAAASTVLWIFVSPPGPILLLTFVVVSMILPHAVINMFIRRREKAFMNEFPEALDLIIRGLKSGLPVTESIRNVGAEFPGPVGVEFRVVTDKIKLGQSIEEALWDAANRIGLQDFKFFVISLAVQRETGGNLAETLENLVDILRKRRQMKLKVKAMSSEAKASALILGSLPFIMFGILLLLNYEYTSLLFTDKRGMMMVGVGFGFISTGSLVMKKMVSFEI